MGNKSWRHNLSNKTRTDVAARFMLKIGHLLADIKYMYWNLICLSRSYMIERESKNLTNCLSIIIKINWKRNYYLKNNNN